MAYEFLDLDNGRAALPPPLAQSRIVRVRASEQRAANVPAKDAAVLVASQRFDLAVVLSDPARKVSISHMRADSDDAISGRPPMDTDSPASKNRYIPLPGRMARAVL